MALHSIRGSKRRSPPDLRPLSLPDPAPRSSFDRDYWLAHCEGYRVEGEGGRIGFIEEVRFEAANPQSPLLAIRAGRLGRRILVVSSSDVDFIVPRSQQVWLHRTATILSSESA